MNMVRSNNNGSYIVDKKMFWLIGFIMTAMFSLVGVGVSNVVSEIKENRQATSKNIAYDEAQEARIFMLEKQLDRIEAKLDKALSK